MEHLYGTFSSQQITQQKESLHNAIHWLLLHKEQNYPKLDEYIGSLLARISGLNKILKEPPELVTLLSIIQALRIENEKPDCDYKLYRKLVFDAHSLVDRVKE